MNYITEDIYLMNKGFSDSDVLEYIKMFMMINGYTPSIREIGRGMGLKSTSSVYAHFARLVAKGEIIQDKAYQRYRVKGMKYVSE